MLYNIGMTYQELYRWGLQELERAGVAEAKQDARLLLEWCCGTDRNTLLAHGERGISPEECRKYEACIARRREHMPLQYITGEQDFMGLVFKVSQNVLVPRQDTEVLVEEAMRYLHDGMHLLDICTGTGCILLSLLHYSNGCTGVGVDISKEALQIAGENAASILDVRMSWEDCANRFVGMELPSGTEPGSEAGKLQEGRQKIVLMQSDLIAGLDRDRYGKFDMIVSNPPYIRTDVIETLMPEVREYEPRLALDGGEDGLFYYRKIIAQAGGYLADGGMLFFEIGYGQGEAVCRLMEEAGYVEVEVVQDLAGLDRVVHGVYAKTYAGRTRA